MSGVVEANIDEVLSNAAAFQLRMERQCQQIRQYRLATQRVRGGLLTLDEAALEWIERYAATFDSGCPGG